MPKAGVGIYKGALDGLDANCFNPFMPKAGVGIETYGNVEKYGVMFQSIYAQSGRWNIGFGTQLAIIEKSFNPFMPKAGVGIVKEEKADKKA